MPKPQGKLVSHSTPLARVSIDRCPNTLHSHTPCDQCCGTRLHKHMLVAALVPMMPRLQKPVCFVDGPNSRVSVVVVLWTDDHVPSVAGNTRCEFRPVVLRTSRPVPHGVGTGEAREIMLGVEWSVFAVGANWRMAARRDCESFLHAAICC